MIPRRKKKMRERDFDDGAFEYCLAENFWNSDEISRRNAMLTLRGYGLIRRRNILRLKLANARLRGSGKRVVDDLQKELQKSSKAVDEFLRDNLWE